MNRIICFLIFTFTSCSIQEDDLNIDGDWLILSIRYESQEIYPKDKTPSAVRFEIEGFNNLYELQFNSDDSTVIAPGFNSEEIILNFVEENQSLTISNNDSVMDEFKTAMLSRDYKDLDLLMKLDKNPRHQTVTESLDSIRDKIIFNRGSKSPQYDSCKTIYCGKYRVTNKGEGQLQIESEKTKILLLSVKYATKKRIDEMFEGLK